MPGFTLIYRSQSCLRRNENLVYDEINGGNFQLHRFTLNKFINDKIFEESEDGILVLEGVILKRKEHKTPNSKTNDMSAEPAYC